MSSRKRRKARAVRLAIRAHEAFYRNTRRATLGAAFRARHAAVSRRYGDAWIKREYLHNIYVVRRLAWGVSVTKGHATYRRV